VDDNSELVPGSVRSLVAILAHPMNQPVIDPISSSVTEGYGMVQPVSCVSSASVAAWGWRRVILESQCDPEHPPSYIRHLHFDLFAECGFYGKGVYDITTFEVAVADRTPPEIVLSH